MAALEFPYIETVRHGRPEHILDSFGRRHLPMHREDRAKLFQPFDALTELGEALAEKDSYAVMLALFCD